MARLRLLGFSSSWSSAVIAAAPSGAGRHRERSRQAGHRRLQRPRISARHRSPAQGAAGDADARREDRYLPDARLRPRRARQARRRRRRLREPPAHRRTLRARPHHLAARARRVRGGARHGRHHRHASAATTDARSPELTPQVPVRVKEGAGDHRRRGLSRRRGVERRALLPHARTERVRQAQGAGGARRRASR